jgi:flagellar FliL protein
MAKEKKPDASPLPPEAPAPQKKKRNKWLLIAPVLVVVLAAAGAGIWYWLRSTPAGDHATAAKEAPKVKPDKTKPPIFVALETFTVNLQPEAGDHLLQATFSLKVADATVEQSLKVNMPEIRSRLLLLLSSKRPSELTSVEGKQALATQLATEVNRVLNPVTADEAAPDKAPEGTAAPAAPGSVLSVYFTNFIIQ